MYPVDVCGAASSEIEINPLILPRYEKSFGAHLPVEIINDNPKAEALFTTDRERCVTLIGGDPIAVSDDDGISKLKRFSEFVRFSFSFI